MEDKTEEKFRLGGFTKLHWYAAYELKKILKESNRNRQLDFSKAIVQAIEHIYQFLKSEYNKATKNDNMQDIPSNIAPKRFLKKLRDEINTRKRFGFSMLYIIYSICTIFKILF